ncbi:MAG: hypothetical protein AAFV53_31440 [Myxococcota bacterium]
MKVEKHNLHAKYMVYKSNGWIVLEADNQENRVKILLHFTTEEAVTIALGLIRLSETE